MLNRQGFSLLEMLIGLIISSILVLSAFTLLTYIQHYLLGAHHRYQLKQHLRQVILNMEKDLRRAGFLAGKGQQGSLPVVVITNRPPCLVVIYDIDKKGTFNLSHTESASLLAYRLNDNAIEYQRGTQNCQSGGWEKLTDVNQFVVTDFHVQQFPHYFRLDLTAHRKKQSQASVTMTQFVRWENQP